MKRVKVMFVFGLIFLVLGAVNVFANGSQDPAGGAVNLRIGWFGTTARNEATLKALDAYTKAHPNVTFSPEIAGNNPEFAQKLVTQAPARNLPDILVMDMGWIKDYSSKGQLLALTDVGTSKIAKALLDDGSLNGKLYALPNATASTAFVYDKQRVAALGLASMVKNGWTWDEFFAFAEAAKQKIGPSSYAVQDFSYMFTQYMAFQQARGHGSPITMDGKINFNKQDWMDFQNKYADFRARGVVPPADYSALNRDGDPTNDALLAGKVVLKSGFSSTFGTWDGVNPGRYALVTFPRGTQSGDYVKVASFWSASAFTKHPKETQAVIDWLVNSVEAGQILQFVRGTSTNSDVLAALAPSLSERDTESAALVDYIAAHNPQPFAMQAPGWDSFYLTDYEAIVQQFMFGKKNAEQVYNEVLAKAREYVK
jgi:ABC-type glycerol-3-phosphate transport system substrate-binding protein